MKDPDLCSISITSIFLCLLENRSASTDCNWVLSNAKCTIFGRRPRNQSQRIMSVKVSQRIKKAGICLPRALMQWGDQVTCYLPTEDGIKKKSTPRMENIYNRKYKIHFRNTKGNLFVLHVKILQRTVSQLRVEAPLLKQNQFP